MTDVVYSVATRSDIPVQEAAEKADAILECANDAVECLYQEDWLKAVQQADAAMHLCADIKATAERMARGENALNDRCGPTYFQVKP